MSIGLGGLIFIVFLFLKLAGIGDVATWSWWAVTSPLWIGAAISALFFLIAAIFAGTIYAVSKPKKRSRW
jgi:hypothetical protein